MINTTTRNTKLLPHCIPLILCLAAPAAHAAPFSSPSGYTMNVPAGWHVQSPSLPRDDADIVADQEVSVGHQMIKPFFQVQFRSFNSPVTPAVLQEINQGALFTIRQRFPDLKVLSQTYSTLDGVRDLDCIFTVTAHGVPQRFHEVLVVKNKKAFTFTSFCPSQVYPKYAAAYTQMLSSVRWKS